MLTIANKRMNIADRILEQLGGARFLTMTGARDVMALPNGLTLRLQRAAEQGINSVVIRLDATNDYTLLFNRRSRSGLDLHLIASAAGVRSSELAAVFTAKTGLDTHL